MSAATVSSIMMGFGWGTGGLSVPIVGMIADRVGIEPTLSGLALVPLVAAACALPLPSRARQAIEDADRPADLAVAEAGPLKSLWYDSPGTPAQMSRYAPSSSISYSFGPGPITFAVKWIIIINVGVFVVTTFAPTSDRVFRARSPSA